MNKGPTGPQSLKSAASARPWQGRLQLQARTRRDWEKHACFLLPGKTTPARRGLGVELRRRARALVLPLPCPCQVAHSL